MLHLLVNFLVQACEVSRKVSPWQTRVPTRFWEAVIVIIGLHVIRFVGIFASEQSYFGTVANGDLGLVPWVCRVSHSCHVHIRVEHDWQDLGSQMILVRLNILAFYHLSNLFL